MEPRELKIIGITMIFITAVAVTSVILSRYGQPEQDKQGNQQLMSDVTDFRALDEEGLAGGYTREIAEEACALMKYSGRPFEEVFQEAANLAYDLRTSGKARMSVFAEYERSVKERFDGAATEACWNAIVNFVYAN